MTPLYPSEAEIAILVLGEKRAKQWPSIAKVLEDKEGLPRIDPLCGGRYWPAVDAYFRDRNRGVPVVSSPSIAPRGQSQVKVVPWRENTSD